MNKGLFEVYSSVNSSVVKCLMRKELDKRITRIFTKFLPNCSTVWWPYLLLTSYYSVPLGVSQFIEVQEMQNFLLLDSQALLHDLSSR